MDWDLRVNASPDIEPLHDDFLKGPGEKIATLDLAPCLYLGSAGQRCNARATATSVRAINQIHPQRANGSTSPQYPRGAWERFSPSWLCFGRCWQRSSAR